MDEANSTIKNSIVQKIQDESVRYSDYDIGSVDRYLQRIETLNSIESHALLKNIEGQINRMQNIRSALDLLRGISSIGQTVVALAPTDEDSGEDASASDENENVETQSIAPASDKITSEEIGNENLGTRLAMQNELSKFIGEADSREVMQFYDSYEENMEKLEQVRAAAAAHVEQYKKNPSTRRVNGEMLEALAKKITDLKDSANYDYTKKRIGNISDGFENRINLNYLANRFNIMLQNKKFLRELKNKLLPDYDLSNLKDLLSIPVQYSELEIVKYYLDCTMEPYTSIIMIMLDRIARAERQSGNDVWVKVFILNFLDIDAHAFDIMPVDEYIAAIKNTFSPIFSKVDLI